MSREEIQQLITERFADATFEEGGEWLNVQMPAASWKEAALYLRDTAGLDFDFLFCVTCVDWKTHLSMVYHLEATQHRHSVVMKCKLDRENPAIETVANVWRTAEFHEREQAELFGVTFLNHPDPRKLILPDDWVGYPLRKDYEDPINMIKL